MLSQQVHSDKYYSLKIKDKESKMNRITAISLFSGAGGDTLGMENANIDVIGYVEFDKKSIKTHETNFPNCKKIGEDITKIKDSEFEKYKGTVSILFGGFPCQSFSQGGKKNPTDARGFLYQEFVRAARIIKPKIIIGENVQGLLKRKTEDGNSFLDMILNDFEKIGYTMKFKLFNMKEYNVPQDRKRLLLYGIRKDLDITVSLENVIVTERCYNKDILEFSLEDALVVDETDILNIVPFKNFIISECNTQPYGKPPTNLVKCWTNNQMSYRKRSKSTFSCVIDQDDVSRTIISSYGRMPRLFVPVYNNNGFFLRPYTVKELQLIQGFPEQFVFEGGYIDKVKQIGNAVPPIFITHIMNYIVDILNEDIVELE
jgi:DNA (cytosine-5)-methyltransferase 1